MSKTAAEIDRNGDVTKSEFKYTPTVSMDGSQEDHSQFGVSLDDAMMTSTQPAPTASQHVHIKGESDNEYEEPVEIEGNSVPTQNIKRSEIQEICPVDGPCVQCKIEQPCSFSFTDNAQTLYVCNEPCIKLYQAEYPGKYTVTRKKYLIQEIKPKTTLCSECEEKKTCYFYYNYYGEDTHYCSLLCLEGMMADEKDKYEFKRIRVTINQIRPKEGQCLICEKVKSCEFSLVRYGEQLFVCDRTCIKTLNESERGRYYIRKLRVRKNAASNAIDKYLQEGHKIQAKTEAMIKAAKEERLQTFTRRCSQCTLVLWIDENVLTWEAMDFCEETCLGRFQSEIGAICANCTDLVQHTSLGKYCVRFGYNFRQFCNSKCLKEYKKELKICCYCQGNISNRSQLFVAPVGDDDQFKDFCSQSCMEKFDQMSKNPVPQPVWAKCAVCSLEKATTIEVEVTETASQRLCSDPCFAAFKFVYNINPDQCEWCKIYFERNLNKNYTTYDGSKPKCFCSLSCKNIHINQTRVVVSCNWCKSKKYNFDMIRKEDNGQAVMMCSLNCLKLYRDSVNAASASKLVVEHIMPLAKMRKRPDATESSDQEEIHINKAKKFRLESRDSPPPGQKKEARSSSRSETPPARPGSGSATPFESTAPAPENGVGSSIAPRRVQSEMTSQTSDVIPPVLFGTHNAHVINNHGSEEDSEEENEESSPCVSVPRAGRLLFQDMEDEEAFALNTPVYKRPPPSLPAAHGPLDKWQFAWRPCPQPAAPPHTRREPFAHRDTDCGPRVKYSNPYKAFTAIWTPEVMELIARETNRYAREALAAGTLKPGNFWRDTSADELYVYFAVILATGLTVRARLWEYWTNDRAFYNTPHFESVMTLGRFDLLTRCLHFVDNSTIDKRRMTRAQAKVYKIQPIVDHLNQKFGELYTMTQNIAIDESLTQWKGWPEINRLINNRAASDLKSYEVYESSSGYLWRLEVTAGHCAETEDKSPVSGPIPSLILRLVKGLEYQGYTVWMVNNYGSPALARELKSRGFDCVGTFRTNGPHVPEELATLGKRAMAPGHTYGCTSGDVDCLLWLHRTRVALVSTYHGLAIWGLGGVKTPSTFIDYNASMAAIDKKDHKLAAYPIDKTSTRVWYKKLFRRLLNASVLNAHVMYRDSHPTVTHRDFRKQLCKQLVSKHSVSADQPVATSTDQRIPGISKDQRIPGISKPTAGHFPMDYADHRVTRVNKKTQSSYRRCKVCKQKSETFCEGCDLPLCLYACFKQYHLNNDLN